MKKALYFTLGASALAALALSAFAGFITRGVCEKYMQERKQTYMLDMQEAEMEAFCHDYGIGDPGEYFSVLKAKGLRK